MERQAEELADLAEKYAEEKTRAEEANQAKSKFLANMSHELRTPLNAIIGFSEIMAAGDVRPDRHATSIQRILRATSTTAAQYLLDVINDILDMSKIEAGKVELQETRERVELEPFLDDVDRAVVSGRANRQATSALPHVEGLPLLFVADSRLLKQIVLNLLSNAVKFTPRAVASRSAHARTSEWVSIAIADTGIGIPEEALARLGRPFEQVESQLTKSHQGSGLGLAIAKFAHRIAPRHHSHPLDAGDRHNGGAAAADRPDVPAQA